MLYQERRFRVSAHPAIDAELFQKLSASNTLCTGYKAGDFIFLNDSTSEDAVQEYAVCLDDGDRIVQIESFTVGWMRCDEFLQAMQELADSKLEDCPMNVTVTAKLQTQEAHGRCQHCA